MNKKEIVRLRILEGFIVVFLILFTFITVLMHDHNLRIKEMHLENKHGRVISSLENITSKNPRIADLALLAAHDSNTYNMKFNAPMDEAERNTAVGKTMKMSEGMQYRFSVTQQSNLYEQFMQGVRVFHIKYTWYKGEWYGTHAKLTGKISDYVIDIMRGLDENPGEFVVMLFHPMCFGDASLGDFHNYLENVRYKGKNIYDYISYGKVNTFNDSKDDGLKIGELRYNTVTNHGTQSGAILMDRRESKLKLKYDVSNDRHKDQYFDIDSNTDHKWHARGNSKNIIKEIDKNMERIKGTEGYQNKLRINQSQLSFSTKDGMSSIFKWSLYNMASRHNPKLLENKNFDKWLEYMPIVKCDFVTSHKKDFNNRINKRLFDYNTRLIAKM